MIYSLNIKIKFYDFNIIFISIIFVRVSNLKKKFNHLIEVSNLIIIIQIDYQIIILLISIVNIRHIIKITTNLIY